MKKKALLLTALLAAGSLAACGGTPDASSNQGSNDSASQSAEEEKIELTAEKSTIYVGETVKVRSSVEGVTFSSRDENIATVDENGVVTALMAGTATITARKSGYKTGSVSITIEKAPLKEAQGILEFEDAEHYDPDDFWGMSYGGQVYGPGETPVEETASASGGKSVGWFNQGCKETIYFTPSKAGKIDMGFMMAYNSDKALEGLITIKVNGVELSLAGKVVAGPSDGDTNNYYDWNEVMFTGVDVIAGENTIVVECVGQSGVNMDCVRLYGEGFTFQQRKVVPLPKLTVTSGAISIYPGETSQIAVTEPGVAYASGNDAIATVSASGLVTAVAPGRTSITISKDGYKNASVDVTVKEPLPTGNFEALLEMEDAEHYAPDGIWGYPDWGMSFDTPVEDHAGAASGDKSIGWFNNGCKETLTFSADKAGTATLSFMMAYASDMTLANVITIKVNGADLDLSGKVLEGGGNNVYTDWKAVNFTNIAIQKGDNTIVVEAIGNGPNMDCVKIISNEDLGIVAKGATLLPKINVVSDKLSVEIGSTVQIQADAEGVTYVSGNADIASVDATGLVTGVAAGKVNITVSKEGYRDAIVEITVSAPAGTFAHEYLLEMEDAEHYIDGDIWGNAMWGMTYDTPVEDHPGAASGDKSVGWFNAPAKETVKFTATSAGTANLSFYMASANNITLSSAVTITVNGVALDLTDKVVEGGGQNVYTDWKAIDFSGVAIQTGANEIVITAISNGPNLDCIKVYSNDDLGVVQTKVVPLPKLELAQASASVVVGETVQLAPGVEGVSYATENAAIATVTAAGVVTGVAKGTTNIIVSKEGFKDAKIAINVTDPLPVYEGFVLEMEDAEHYSPDGSWGNGWSPAASPVENNEFSSGGQSLGNFKTGCKETLTFNSNQAGQITIKLYAASTVADWSGGYGNINMADMQLASYMSLSVNEAAVSLEGKVAPGTTGQNYYNFQPIEISINVQAGPNTIVFEITGQQGPNMDCVVIPAQTGFVFTK